MKKLVIIFCIILTVMIPIVIIIGSVLGFIGKTYFKLYDYIADGVFCKDIDAKATQNILKEMGLPPNKAIIITDLYFASLRDSTLEMRMTLSKDEAKNYLAQLISSNIIKKETSDVCLSQPWILPSEKNNLENFYANIEYTEIYWELYCYEANDKIAFYINFFDRSPSCVYGYAKSCIMNGTAHIKDDKIELGKHTYNSTVPIKFTKKEKCIMQFF